MANDKENGAVEMSQLRRCQLMEYHLLEELDLLCKRHGIQYFLVGGTLLGAMRHDGFIPWDDDVDVGMLRDDFKKFLRVASRELPEWMLLQRPSDSFSTVPFAKLRDRNSFFGDLDAAMLYPSGIFIDIFPYERMPHLPYKWIYFLVRWRFGAFRRFRQSLLRARYSALAKGLDSLTGIFWKCVNLAGKIAWHGLRLVAPARGWHVIPECGYTNRMPDGGIMPVGEHLFERKMFPIPKDWEAMLKSEYSNWREVPPPDQRSKHSTFVFFSSAIENRG